MIIVPSYPTTEMSSGTEQPWRRTPRMAPSAM
ncbi:hypothetical protein M271_09170 [Streptomyces rapamycinicus NRRL 5491]|uniref:Uncharacterized protein n=1 Tax=Streptomyces rapamycinicus TaxID=1226757 RepID=A0ABR6LFS4_9ACTN|nr:hypothetical protein M271_09170 [Streptomyces rapamycinicus NRRL 5491]MBB4780931.1 hypothetical protein [Streptomyces rapamycinicus]